MKSPIIEFIKNSLYHGLEYYGRYYSTYRGIVADRDDPDHQGRVRLIVPGIIDDPTDYWAPNRGVYSGKNYGAHIIPNTGDIVWVTFEYGDPNKPIYELGYTGKNEIVNEQLKNVDNYWFRTPNGQTVEIDDTNKLIRITQVSGRVITINETGVSIESDKIFLGSLDDADEPGVLGDTLQQLLEKILENQTNFQKNTGTAISQLADAINNLTLAVVPNQFIAQLLGAMKAQGIKATQTKVTYNTRVTNHNNSNTKISENLPKMKSKTVKLDK